MAQLTLDGEDEEELMSEFLQFPPEVQEAMEQVLPSTDPLDQVNFNAVDYINTLFPTEQSLANVDDVMARMKLKISQLDEEIRLVVRGQTNSCGDGRQSLQDAQISIHELYKCIKDIKDKAELSEQTVKEITRDIKQLDHAKRHLTSSITTLNHLHMLLEGVESLRHLASRRNYGEIANLLQGVINVLEHFKPYMGIAQISKLSQEIKDIRNELSEQITTEFQAFFTGQNPKAFSSNQQLAEACVVLNHLDSNVKNSLLKWFVQLQLKEYKVLFSFDQECAWLDKVDKRYSWLKNHLLEFEKKLGNLFPAEWDMSERIAVEFCHVTRQDLTEMMTSRVSQISTELLLSAIQKTTSFETLLGKRFAGLTLGPTTASVLLSQTVASNNGSSKSSGTTSVSTNPFEEAYDDRKNPFICDADDATSGTTETSGHQPVANPKTAAVANSNPFHGIISRCFEAHLNIYMERRDADLRDMIENMAVAMKQTPLPRAEIETANVFASCGDLFMFYKKCLVQCTQFTTGQPIVALAETFQRHLNGYAEKVLLATLPKSVASGGRLMQNLQQLVSKESEASQQRMTPGEIVRVCSVITTAEYCLETAQQLEGKLKEKVDRTLVDSINFSPQYDVFNNVIQQCIQLLVSDLENACEPALVTMNRIAWSSVSHVGDQSAYVTTITNHLTANLTLLRDNLANSRKYFTQFCVKFASSFMPKILNHLFKCRTLSAEGAEQLLLDVHMLKTVLLDLPLLGSQVALRKAPASYTKIVLKEMTRAEMVLKVVMARHDPRDAFIENFFRLLPESGLTEFKKILDMKGIKGNDYTAYSDLFCQMRAALPPSNTSDNPAFSTVNSGFTTKDQDSSRIRRIEKLIKRL